MNFDKISANCGNREISLIRKLRKKEKSLNPQIAEEALILRNCGGREKSLNPQIAEEGKSPISAKCGKRAFNKGNEISLFKSLPFSGAQRHERRSKKMNNLGLNNRIEAPELPIGKTGVTEVECGRERKDTLMTTGRERW